MRAKKPVLTAAEAYRPWAGKKPAQKATAAPAKPTPPRSPPGLMFRTDAGHENCSFVYVSEFFGGRLYWSDRMIFVHSLDGARIEQACLTEDVATLVAYVAEHPAPAPCKCSGVEVVLTPRGVAQ